MNDTPAPVSRPHSVDYLLNDYGSYLGLPGLAFDDDQQILLEIDGVDLIIEYIGEGAGLLLQSVIRLETASLGDDVHTYINSLNAQLFRSGGGIVIAIPDSSAFLWMDRFGLEGLTVETLDEIVKRAVSRVSSCTEHLAEAFLPEDAGAMAPAADTSHLIRI